MSEQLNESPISPEPLDGEQLSPAGTGAAQFVLGGRFVLQPEVPLPQFDSPEAKAYLAVDRRSLDRRLFFLACRPDLRPRTETISTFMRMNLLPIVAPISAGVMAWPNGGGRRFAIVFTQPDGERVMPMGGSKIDPISADDLIRKILASLMPALKELCGTRSVVHRNIRADNVFYNSSERSEVVLGECVSTPVAFSQPVVCEPIPSGMSMRTGRGLGTAADDLYSLGVLMLTLLFGETPAQGMSDKEIVSAKIRLGSYAVLVGQKRIPQGLMEPLRGLLCDNSRERWRYADLEKWMNGLQLTPKPTLLPTRAARSIALLGKEYWTTESLSNAMCNNWDEAVEIIRNGDIGRWLHRSLSDADRAAHLENIIHLGDAFSDSQQKSDDNIVSNAQILLYSEAPIRYRNISAQIDGLPQVLAMNFENQEIKKLFAEIVLAKIPQKWIAAQSVQRPEYIDLKKMYEMMSYFLSRSSVGYGLERILYEANQGWPCQSPLLAGEHICEIGELLPALEQLAAKGSIGQEPIDAHIVAFCAARTKPTPEHVLRDLANNGPDNFHAVSVLRLFAEVQRTAHNAKMPALGKLLAQALGPAIESFHNRAYKQLLADKIEEIAGEGDLLRLLAYIDNPGTRHKDSSGYARAQAAYVKCDRELDWLTKGGLISPLRIQKKSEQTAVVTSAILASLSLVLMTLIYLN